MVIGAFSVQADVGGVRGCMQLARSGLHSTRTGPCLAAVRAGACLARGGNPPRGAGCAQDRGVWKLRLILPGLSSLSSGALWDPWGLRFLGWSNQAYPLGHLATQLLLVDRGRAAAPQPPGLCPHPLLLLATLLCETPGVWEDGLSVHGHNSWLSYFLEAASSSAGGLGPRHLQSPWPHPTGIHGLLWTHRVSQWPPGVSKLQGICTPSSGWSVAGQSPTELMCGFQ